MGKFEALAEAYERHINGPWQRTLAGAQRILFVVYDKADERQLRARLAAFEQATIHGGHLFSQCDCTTLFAEWMAAAEYREAYFEQPDDLRVKLDTEFHEHVIAHVRRHLATGDDAADSNRVVALTGLGSLYPFVHISVVLREVEPDIRGRLAAFFPGSKVQSSYRLLDAREGFNYLGACITSAEVDATP